METGPTFWLVLLTIGVVALGLAMAFGISQNRRRTPAEKQLTAVATKREARSEDADNS